MGIRHILVVIIAGFLPHRIRRVADNNLNRRLHLFGSSICIGLENACVCFSFTGSYTLCQLEGIRQNDAFKRHIILALAQLVISFFNIDRCNVVSKQDNFVAMDFAGILVQQVFRLDDTAAQQANNEGSCTCERVEDMNPHIAYAMPKALLHHILYRPDDKVNHFHRGIDDA